MNINRREFAKMMSLASFAGLLPGCAHLSKSQADFYRLKNFGDARLLHMTDCHAQLNPVYFREPDVNLGVGASFNKAPHLVGQHFLNQFDIPVNSQAAHAFTSLNFVKAAKVFGKVGGFAHLKTLVDQLRGDYGIEKTLLLDGGDTWQGSGTSYWTQGEDMVGACNLLGVDIMTGHWEFTYPDKQVLKNIQAFNGEFLAQNIRVSEEALFEDAPAYDLESGHAFKSYTIKELNGHRIAIIGQAFPYTPIANPKRFIPDWSFGIRPKELQELVNTINQIERPEAIVLLSHNGMDVDLKLASIISDIDVILGGHTHDGIPQAIEVSNPTGTTLVTNAGSNGKYLGVLDLAFSNGRLTNYRYKLLPVFANLLPADKTMKSYIEQVRAPYSETLNRPLAISDDLLYRRGNFNGSFDQVICQALNIASQSQIALSPGFRWGTSVLPNQLITFENLLDQTCITYPETYVRNLTGQQLKLILEDVADNLFNPDPFYQQGGDMVRTGGLNYTIDPFASAGNRISEMRLEDGELIQASKSYRVSGWATVNQPSAGPPIWEVVSEYLISQQQISIKSLNQPRIKNIQGNKGII